MGKNRSRGGSSQGNVSNANVLTVDGTDYPIQEGVGIPTTKGEFDEELVQSFSPTIYRDTTREEIYDSLRDHIGYVYDTYYAYNGTFPSEEVFRKYVEQEIYPKLEEVFQKGYAVLEEHPDMAGIDTTVMLGFDSDDVSMGYFD